MGLENRLNSGNGSGKNLEEKVSFTSALKKFTLWDWTKIIGFSAIGAAFSGGLLGYGAINVMTTTSSFLSANYLINRKKGFTKNSLQTDFVLGAPYTVVIYKLFEWINVFTPDPLAWMAAYALSLYPLAAATNAMKYMIEKYSPSTFLAKGIFEGKLFWDISHIARDAVTNSVRGGAQTALWMTLPVTASHYLLPESLLIPSLYPIRTGLKYILEAKGQKKEQSMAPSYRPHGYLPQTA